MADVIPVPYDPFDGNGGSGAGDVVPVPYDPFERPEQTINAATALPANVIEDPARMARTGTLAISSLPTDEMARVKYLAQQRFPEDSSALDRYFYKDGRLAYKDSDGKAYYEDPAARAPTSVANIAQDAKGLATMAGPGMVPLASTAAGIGSIAEGPVGWFSGAPQVAAASAGASALRQGLANWLTGETKDWADRAKQTGGDVGQSLVGQILSNGLVKGLNFLGFGHTPTYNIPEVEGRRANADRFGVFLTPAEESGNRTLINRQRLLQNTAGADEKFAQMYTKRNDQVGAAVDNMVSGLDPAHQNEVAPAISPEFSSARIGAASGVEGAQAAVVKAQRDLIDKAKPFYRVSIQPENMVPADQISQLPSAGRIEYAIKQVKADPAYADSLSEWLPLGTTPEQWERNGLKDNSMPVLYQAKKYLDGLTQKALNQGDLEKAALWGSAATDLKGTMVGNFPTFGRALQIYTEGMPARTAVERGQVGDMSKLANDDVSRAPAMVFGPASSPEDVKIAREAFEKAGKMDQWDALAGSYLRQTFSRIPDTTTGTIPNLGGVYRKTIFGTPPRRAMMQEAFAHRPGFFQDMSNLMDTLDATSAASRSDSITAFAQAGQKQLEREANAGAIWPKAALLIDPLEWGGRLSNLAKELNTEKYAARQAELFTTPEGRDVLKELRKIGPSSAGAVMALSQFLTGGASGVARSPARPMNGPVVPPAAIGANP